MATIALRVPTPLEIVRGAFRTVEWSLETARVMSTLPVRVVILLDSAEALVARVDEVVDSAASAVEAVDRIISSADRTVAAVGTTVASADAVVARVDGVVEGVEMLLGRADPLLDLGERVVRELGPLVEEVLLGQGFEAEMAARVMERLAELAVFGDRILAAVQPIVTEIVDSIDPEEVRAVVDLIDHLPALTSSLEKDVLPVLANLDTVAPEVTQILSVAQDCLEALAGIPGFTLLRRRGESRVE